MNSLSKITPLIEEITSLKNQINTNIYNLYELSEEEIELIEKSLEE